MAATRILNLFALISLATLLTTFGTQPALALERRASPLGRRSQHHHLAENQLIKKRSSSKKCKARPSSSAPAPPAPTTTDSPKPTTKPTTTQKSSPKPTQSQPSGGGGGGGDGPSSGPVQFKHKLGIAWADGGADYLLDFTGKVGWFYNWGADAPPLTDKLGAPYLPQAWGWKDGAEFLKVSLKSDAPLFLTINEPNEGGQANMDVGSGCSFWNQYVKPVQNQGKKIASPATSSNPKGFDWVVQFQKQCGAHWDVTALHWYDTTFDKFKDYVEKWHNQFNTPIIITEFALQNFNGGGQPSLGEIYDFFGQAIPWLESQDYVIGYAPFGFMAPPTGINVNMNLLTGGGSPTSLGGFILDKA